MQVIPQSSEAVAAQQGGLGGNVGNRISANLDLKMPRSFSPIGCPPWVCPPDTGSVQGWNMIVLYPLQREFELNITIEFQIYDRISNLQILSRRVRLYQKECIGRYTFNNYKFKNYNLLPIMYYQEEQVQIAFHLE